jgi:hypothetical protein
VPSLQDFAQSEASKADAAHLGCGRRCESLRDLTHITAFATGLTFSPRQATTAGAFDGGRHSYALEKMGKRPLLPAFRQTHIQMLRVMMILQRLIEIFLTRVHLASAKYPALSKALSRFYGRK